MNKGNNRYLLIIILLATVLRLYGLGRMALWGDEACMVYLCMESPGQIVSALASADRPDVDVAPPVYFILLHAWMTLLGNSVYAFRGFSVVFGILTVWAVYGLGSRLFNPKVGLLSALLAAVHPFQVWYSQEGRMYSLAAFLSALSMYLLAGALQTPLKRSRWALFAICGLTLLYTQYYGALLLTALVIYAGLHILKMTAHKKTAAISMSSVVVFWTIGFLPWLPVLLTDYRHASAPGGFPLMFHWLMTPAWVFVKNILFGLEMYVRNNIWLYPLPLVIGAIYLVKALKSWKTPGVKMLVMAFAIPFGIIYGLSLVGLRLYKSHPFILFHPAIIVLLAYGFTQMTPKFRRISGSIFLMAQIFVLLTLVLGGEYQKPRVHDIADRIEQTGGLDAYVAVIPAFIPNPMPIVGDLLAFRYHTKGRFNTVYLYGDTAEELADKTMDHIAKQETFYLVYQDNVHVRPYVDQVMETLNKKWQITDVEEFSSKNRDFSMTLVVYETNPL